MLRGRKAAGCEVINEFEDFRFNGKRKFFVRD